MLYLTASSDLRTAKKSAEEEPTKKRERNETKTNLNLSTNLLLMRYLSFSSSFPFLRLFPCLSAPDNTKDVHVRKLHLKSGSADFSLHRAARGELETEILKMHQLLHIFHVSCAFACDRLTLRSTAQGAGRISGMLHARDEREKNPK